MTTTNINFNVKNGLNAKGNMSIAGSLVASTFIASNISATTSNAWTNPMTLTRTGDVSGIGSFTGASPTTIAMTLAASGVTAGTYNQISVNSKGLVIAGVSSTVSGTDATGVIKASLVNLSNNGYLPLSIPSLSQTYTASLYSALASLLGVTNGVPTGSQVVLPISANWDSVCWNGSLFVAVASSGTYAASSPDGINWTSRSLPVSTNWSSVAWGGSLFVAVAHSGVTGATSPDGINWTSRSLPVSTSWLSVCWGGSLFVAIAGGSSYAASSPDGINWTSRSLPVNTYWQLVCWGGSLFIAVASSGTYAASSPDGINWTSRSLPVSASWGSVCWGGSLFIAVASTSTIAATITTYPSTFTTPTYTGTLGIANANWYIKT